MVHLCEVLTDQLIRGLLSLISRTIVIGRVTSIGVCRVRIFKRHCTARAAILHGTCCRSIRV